MTSVVGAQFLNIGFPDKTALQRRNALVPFYEATGIFAASPYFMEARILFSI
jgi:hypothetical protein